MAGALASHWFLQKGGEGTYCSSRAALEATQGKWMVSLVNSHTHATTKRWHLWEIDLRFAPGLPPGWPSTQPPRASIEGRASSGCSLVVQGVHHNVTTHLCHRPSTATRVGVTLLQ